MEDKIVQKRVFSWGLSVFIILMLAVTATGDQKESKVDPPNSNKPVLKFKENVTSKFPIERIKIK